MSSTTPRFLRFLKWLRLALLILLCLPVVLSLYSCATQNSVRKSAALLDCDPITRVVRGTEARTLEAHSTDDTTGLTSSTAVLMIHGYLSSNQDFGDLPEQLAAEGLAVRLMRLPGHGTTPLDLAGQPDGALYEAVEIEFAALQAQYDRVRVIGFSMGGALGTILAAHNDVDRLALVAPYYKVTYTPWYVLPPEAWQFTIGWAVPLIKRPSRFVKINDKSAVGKYFMYSAFPSSSVTQLMDIGREARHPETLSRVKCPVFLVHSTSDGAACSKASRRAFEAMASKKKTALWLEEGRCDHVLLWDYEKETVCDELLRFLTAE